MRITTTWIQRDFFDPDTLTAGCTWEEDAKKLHRIEITGVMLADAPEQLGDVPVEVLDALAMRLFDDVR